MFKNLKIGTKLFIGFMLVTSMVAFIGATSFNTNKETSLRLQKLSRVHQNQNLYNSIQIHSTSLSKLKQLIDTDPKKASTLYTENIDPYFQTNILSEMRSLQKAILRHEHEILDMRKFIFNGGKNIMALTIIPLLMAMIIGIFLTYRLTKPILDARDFANRVASGDMDVEIDTSRMDEIGELMRAIDKMRLELKKVVSDRIS